MEQTARDFIQACETSGGWDACRAFCHDPVSFACQADGLADILILEAVDAERSAVVATAVLHGTQTGAGGPVEPTGRSVASYYAYMIRFEGDRIAHMPKIWSDVQAQRQLGWA